MSDWYGYQQAGGAGLTRPWWRSVPPGHFVLTGPGPNQGIYQPHFYRGDQYEVRQEAVALYQSYDPAGLPVGLPLPSLDDAEADVDVLSPVPVPSPLVGQVWVQDNGLGARLARMVIGVEGDGSPGTLVRFSEAPGGPAGFTAPWTFKNPTGAAATAGTFRMDNASQPLVSLLYVNDLDAVGNSQAALLALVVAGNVISMDGGGHMVTFTASGPAVLGAGVWTIPVVYVSDTGELANNSLTSIGFLAAGAPLEIYEVGVNWPVPDSVLVAGPGHPWSPVPLPVIP